jgi:hypothetical protein
MPPVNHSQNLVGKRLVEGLTYSALSYLYTKIGQNPKKGDNKPVNKKNSNILPKSEYP